MGFGTGYGAALLSTIPNSHITGVDISLECKIFAQQYYSRSNVTYIIEDLQTYIPHMPFFDYVVSRGVLEHVCDGLNLIKKIHCKKRIMINVPYKEQPGNEHHVITGITEADFKLIDNCEFFYEDLNGNIYDATSFPPDSKMIMVIISDSTLPKIKDLFEFPIPAVTSNELEILSQKNMTGSRYYFESPGNFLTEVEYAIKETDVVVDIGCGIRPMNYFRPKLHIMVEPWKEYVNILTYRHAGDKSILIMQLDALKALKGFATNSIDSIFLYFLRHEP